MKNTDLHLHIFNNTSQVVLIFDDNLTLTGLNAAAKKELTGIKFTQGKNLSDFAVNFKSHLTPARLLRHNNAVKLILISPVNGKVLVLEGKHLRHETGKKIQHIFLLQKEMPNHDVLGDAKPGSDIDPLEKVLQNVDIVFFRVKIDPNGRKNLFYISRRVSEVFGMGRKQYIQSIKDGSIFTGIHKDDYNKIIRTNEEIFTKKKPSQAIYRFYNRQKKKYVWIEEKGYPVLDEKGRLVEMYGISRDVNERIETEEKLNDIASLYRGIIDNSETGYYRLNNKNIILEANRSFARILGYKDKKELVGKTIDSLYKSSTDGELFNKTLLHDKKLLNHESRVILMSGEERFFLENAAYFKNIHTGQEYVEGTIFDITEFKQTQLALQQSEIKYKKLFDENLSGVFRTNVNGHIYDCNQSFLDMFGYKSKAELVKKSSVSLYFSKAYRDKYIRNLRRSGILKNYEIEHRKKDGSKIWALINAVLVKEGKDEIIQGNLIDITEQKLTSDRLIQNIDKYHKLFEHATDAILMVKQWKIIDCNGISTKLLKTTKQKLIGRNFSDIIAYDALSAEQKKTYKSIFVDQNLTRNKVYECVLKGPGRERTHVNISVSVVTENNDDLYQLIIHDNTKHIQEQKELEESRNNFENLIEYSPDGNLIVHNNKVIFANVAATKILGLKAKSSVLNKPVPGFFIPKQQPEIKRLIERVKTKKEKTRFYEYTIKSRTGNAARQTDVGVQFINVNYGGLDCVNMILYDLGLKKQLAQQEMRANIAEETNKKLEHEIQQHKLTQNRLSKQIAMTNALLEGSQNVLIYTLDRKYRLTSLNSIFEKTARQIFDYDLKIGEQFTPFLEKVITPQDRQIMYKKFRQAFKGESVRLEGPLKIKHGGIVWIETFINPIKKGKNVVEISCISTDITDKKLKNEELKSSLKEKEVLLKEVHHRVKNNLQIISSILNLQTSFSNDARVNEILRESQNRVKSMAYLHESLYQNKNFSFINFSDYLINLSKNLVHSYYFSQSLVDLRMDVDKVDLNLDQAIPCGLIVNELLTNAVKYAFTGNKEQGVISIRVKDRNGLIEITVADNGRGLPKGFDVNKTNSLGLQLVSTLTEQLEGRLSVQNDKGAKFIITFKKC